MTDLYPSVSSGRVVGFARISLLAAALAGCAAAPPEQPRVPLMGHPVLTGLAQVRDPVSGDAYFVPCNPCAAPTPKTPVLGGYAAPADAPVARPAPEPVAVAPLPSAAPVAPAAAADTPPAPVVVEASRGVLASAAALAAPAGISASRTILFRFGATDLDSASRRAVGAIAARFTPGATIRVRGHTDAIGDPVVNRVIAKARAATVRAALVAAGVPVDAIETTHCIDCYIASNATAAGRRANRRAEVTLTLPGTVLAEHRASMSDGLERVLHFARVEPRTPLRY